MAVKFGLRSLGAACFAALLAGGVLGGCEEARYREMEDPAKGKPQTGPVFKDEGKAQGSILGDGLIFGGEKKRKGEEGGEGSGIGVNSFLWRASLDTIAFMPVASADPFGGVIITDWHTQPESPSERFKLNVYIMGRSLRADGVRVSVFRQVAAGGSWADAPVPGETATRIEDAILTRARQMRNETLNK
ncbi:MAG: DUF3576 domain-containing protein [Magnetospirillum sp. WYHS-4]